MIYEESIRQQVLDALHKRVSSISGIIITLSNNGFTPNKNKLTKLIWNSMLIDAYENINVFDEERHKKLDNLYNEVANI